MSVLRQRQPARLALTPQDEMRVPGVTLGGMVVEDRQGEAEPKRHQERQVNAEPDRLSHVCHPHGIAYYFRYLRTSVTISGAP